ncbi:MAG TPA: hypothetical protein VKS44_09905 [Candidatus Acidoferrales bacterium]|nr:hypothetical protein [Candidatus Acidoferrales bacterium]
MRTRAGEHAASIIMFRKKPAPASTHKRVVALLLHGPPIRGYLDAGLLGHVEAIDLLTPDGDHRSIPTDEVKCVYFVREFGADFDLERKTFLSRPKLDGLWVRLRFRDEDVLEGIVANDLLGLLNFGVQLTPPDLHGNTLRVFVPRSALLEMKVLGVVGAARRATRPPAAAQAEAGEPAQTKLFNE